MLKATTALGLTFAVLAASVSGANIAAAQTFDKKAVIDKDGDHVIDAQGDCVITKWGVDNNGCGGPVAEPEPEPEPEPVTPARKLTLEQKTVYFDFDKSNLDESAKARLDRLAQAVKNSSDVKHVKIVGYADYLGTSSYNQALSARRSQAVAQYLRAKGIYNTNVEELRALGERTASPKCKSIPGRQERIACLRTDRRVEIEIEYLD